MEEMRRECLHASTLKFMNSVWIYILVFLSITIYILFGCPSKAKMSTCDFYLFPFCLHFRNSPSFYSLHQHVFFLLSHFINIYPGFGISQLQNCSLTLNLFQLTWTLLSSPWKEIIWIWIFKSSGVLFPFSIQNTSVRIEFSCLYWHRPSLDNE